MSAQKKGGRRAVSVKLCAGVCPSSVFLSAFVINCLFFLFESKRSPSVAGIPALSSAAHSLAKRAMSFVFGFFYFFFHFIVLCDEACHFVLRLSHLVLDTRLV